MEKQRITFQKGDFLAIFLVVLLAAAVAFAYIPRQTGQEAVAVVFLAGEQVGKLPLSENAQITVKGTYTNVVSVQDGKVCVTYSDCPGEDCVHSAAISGAGRSIVCLPNQMEVRVLSGGSQVDFVVG